MVSLRETLHTIFKHPRTYATTVTCIKKGPDLPVMAYLNCLKSLVPGGGGGKGGGDVKNDGHNIPFQENNLLKLSFSGALLYTSCLVWA